MAIHESSIRWVTSGKEHGTCYINESHDIRQAAVAFSEFFITQRRTIMVEGYPLVVWGGSDIRKYAHDIFNIMSNTRHILASYEYGERDQLRRMLIENNKQFS